MISEDSKIAGYSAEKRRVALHSMLAAGAMTLLKLAAGLLSGSLGVLSDAAHSGLDLVGSTLTFFSVQVSDRPADEDHTYGHGKFENFSSFGEVLLMAVSSAWIIWEAIQRILHPTKELQNLGLPVAVVVVSIGVDYWRSRRLRAVAERTGSSALALRAGRKLGGNLFWHRRAAFCRPAGGGGGFAFDFTVDCPAGARGGERTAG
jgi:cation diffusion facilitator family transporter